MQNDLGPQPYRLGSNLLWPSLLRITFAHTAEGKRFHSIVASTPLTPLVKNSLLLMKNSTEIVRKMSEKIW